mgnify:FL=1
MMLIRIIIMLLIALFVESRQEAFGQTTDTLSLSDKVIRTASFATGFRGEIWQNPALLLLLYSVYMDKAGRKWSLS